MFSDVVLSGREISASVRTIAPLDSDGLPEPCGDSVENQVNEETPVSDLRHSQGLLNNALLGASWPYLPLGWFPAFAGA